MTTPYQHTWAITETKEFLRLTLWSQALRLGVLFSVPGQVQRGLVHRGQQLQREGKAEFALVDAVDEHLRVDDHALGFQSAREFLVRDACLLTQFFDGGLGSRLVKLARFQTLDLNGFRFKGNRMPKNLFLALINGFPFMYKKFEIR